MKDAKGHGSNARGGSYPNIDKNMHGAGKHVGYAGGENFNIQKSNGAKSTWYSAVGNAGTVFSGKGLGEISGKLADHAAKTELARGSQKSDAAPVHGGTGGGSFFGRSASGAAAAHKEAQDFQRTRATAGPHYLGANDPRSFGPGHTVSQITLGGKVKSVQSAADWAKGRK